MFPARAWGVMSLGRTRGVLVDTNEEALTTRLQLEVLSIELTGLLAKAFLISRASLNTQSPNDSSLRVL